MDTKNLCITSYISNAVHNTHKLDISIVTNQEYIHIFKKE